LLTADLVHVRRRGDRLILVPISAAEWPRARELASTVLALVRGHVGLSRGALLEAWGHARFAPSENRLARALFKLAMDSCEFEEGAPFDAVELRRELFAQAALARATGRPFDRQALLGEIAHARGVGVDVIDRALYADLPSAHVLRSAELPSPDGLLAEHQLASHQAILLRAVQVRARVYSRAAAGYRTLFRKLKFHRLLHGIAKLDRGAGYAIDIDGPFSLFEQTTKYGLKLALALPSIMACDAWDVNAELRWGKDRRSLRYHLRGTADVDTVATAAPCLADDVGALLTDLRQQDSRWEASPSDTILDLPGTGVCVPDLEFIRRADGRRVFLEVLGFWSRAAVWKRIEMARSGLPHPMVFAVGKHLRVSEEALPENAPASLYVYARSMNARAVLERVEAVAGR